ncbi:hypothetical protein HDU91_005684 [Kappamyces sp. JEL0680]|nr:hypothetical protein HDU91_005684 [Kappamyces sp. JEL0680]
MPPGICERLDDELYDATLGQEGGQADKPNSQTASSAVQPGSSRENADEILTSQDLFLLEYPLEEYTLIGSIVEEEENDHDPFAVVVQSRGGGLILEKATEGQRGPSLRQLYGKFIDNNIIKQSSGSDLEQEAILAMKSGMAARRSLTIVSADLQCWVQNVLEQSIILDPDVLAQVAEMDERAGDVRRDKPIMNNEADISGFNVLLNACKPAILEARPPMKLNVVKEVTRGNYPAGNSDFKKHDKLPKLEAHAASAKRKQYGAWYLPPRLWKVKEKEQTNNEFEARRHIFGGIVQQKLDDIARKRATDMEIFMKDTKEGHANPQTEADKSHTISATRTNRKNKK